MRFCPLEKCRWYSEARLGRRKCYYGEPQCWRGWLDLLLGVIALRFQRGKRKDK